MFLLETKWYSIMPMISTNYIQQWSTSLMCRAFIVSIEDHSSQIYSAMYTFIIWKKIKTTKSHGIVWQPSDGNLYANIKKTRLESKLFIEGRFRNNKTHLIYQRTRHDLSQTVTSETEVSYLINLPIRYELRKYWVQKTIILSAQNTKQVTLYLSVCSKAHYIGKVYTIQFKCVVARITHAD